VEDVGSQKSGGSSSTLAEEEPASLLAIVNYDKKSKTIDLTNEEDESREIASSSVSIYPKLPSPPPHLPSPSLVDAPLFDDTRFRRIQKVGDEEENRYSGEVEDVEPSSPVESASPISPSTTTTKSLLDRPAKQRRPPPQRPPLSPSSTTRQYSWAKRGSPSSSTHSGSTTSSSRRQNHKFQSSSNLRNHQEREKQYKVHMEQTIQNQVKEVFKDDPKKGSMVAKLFDTAGTGTKNTVERVFHHTGSSRCS
jgi:flagellar biosynthesis GTPase FlhF